MQVETRTQICPLCRHPVAGEDATLTRLCRDCRAMLDPILPRAGLVQPDYAVSLAGAAAQPATIIAPLALDADFDDVSFAPAAGLGAADALMDEAAADHFDARPAMNAPAETNQRAFVHNIHPLVPEVFIVPDQYENDEIRTTVKAPPSAPAIAPPALSERLGSDAEMETIEAAAASDLRAAAAMPALESRAAPASAPAGDTDLHGLIAEEAATAAAAPPADPWEDPLPAWEYSQNEWPLLVSNQKPSVASKLKWPLVALLIVASAAVAVYFLFIKPRREAPSAPAPSEASAQPSLTVPVAPPHMAEAPPAAANPTSASAATANNNEAPPLASVSQATDNQGKYALQAMASPSEAEANSFVERLKSAAIPAYVVRANLGSHGIWCRVRIGRFATSEDAQRFATEARRRARAIGVTLKNLQVTGYDKP